MGQAPETESSVAVSGRAFPGQRSCCEPVPAEGRQEEGRTQREEPRRAPSWVSGLAGLLGTTCAHVRPDGCRQEAEAAVARGRVRLCWKLFQCGRLRVGTRVRVGGAMGGRHYLVPGRPSETAAPPLAAAR